MNLRLTAIGAGVLIILSLPLAGAIAGPEFRGQDDGKGGGLLTALGLAEDSGRPAGSGPTGQDGRGDAGGESAGAGAGGQPGPSEAPRTDSRCGPELSSPDGVEAQTCVLAGGGQTWGRSYYRNTSGRALDAVLTLMGPAGRTVQIHCKVGAGDEPGLCETPRDRSAGVQDDYTAVAEFAVPDDEGRLLLRSGSNSPVSTDG
ncbi:hypothetical protein DEJ50_16030 [Streptomyces venezuelae]|uniref:Uncharacterized protein n=1 Tax=Streptomyces venezuelae TaxID=54571 RepID=A0A5P2D7I3_STRVZ|nr:hypothetical protein [Streptomyces venezuelae]QES49089.1 hypothetical protein DEJ50_16030 [Streptomyces venezuelae]